MTDEITREPIPTASELAAKWGITQPTESMKVKQARRSLRSVVKKTAEPQQVCLLMRNIPREVSDKGCIALKLDAAFQGRPLTLFIDAQVWQWYGMAYQDFWLWIDDNTRVMLRSKPKDRTAATSDVFFAEAFLDERLAKMLTVSTPRIQADCFLDYRLQSLEIKFRKDDAGDDWKLNGERVQNIGANVFIFDPQDQQKNSQRAWRAYTRGKHADNQLWALYSKWLYQMTEHRDIMSDEFYSFNEFRRLGYPDAQQVLARRDPTEKHSLANSFWTTRNVLAAITKQFKELTRKEQS